MSAPLRALIFDVDGTLAETERDGHRVAFNRAFAEAGLGWHWSPAHYGELLAVTGGKERMLHHWRTLDPAAAARPDAEEQLRMLHARKTAHYLSLVADGSICLRPGVRRLLAEAMEHRLALAIATTTTEANVHGLLGAALGPGWPQVFSVIGAGDLVRKKKPAPDIYHWVLDRLQLAAHDCLALEDSAPGAAAAMSAGIPTVLTRSVYSAHDPIAGVLCDLDGLGDPVVPAMGRAPGPTGVSDWQGMVDIARLRDWHGWAASAPR